jgi:DNA-binding transcriptional LysR family regulator
MLTPSAVPALRIKHLRMVLALAEHRNFGSAAAALKMSQPSLSRAIQRMEYVLGVELFERDTRRVSLTPAGRQFVALAERTINNLMITSRSLNEIAASSRGCLTISTFSAFAVYEMPGFVVQFRKERPEVEVRVREGYQSEIVDDVRNGTADFGVGYLDELPDTVAWQLLAHEPLRVLLPAAHHLGARSGRVSVEELRSEPLVSLPENSSLRRMIDAAAASRGITLRHEVVVDRFLGVINHVEAGVGIGILPSGALPSRSTRCRIAALDPALSVSVGLISPLRRPMTRGAADMMALITTSLDEARTLRAANGL